MDVMEPKYMGEPGIAKDPVNLLPGERLFTGCEKAGFASGAG